MIRNRFTTIGAAALTLLTSALILGLCAVGLAQKGKPPTPPPTTPEKIAYTGQTGRSGPYQIFTVNSDGTAKIQLTNNKTYGSVSPDWSPDLDSDTPGYQGGKIAYRMGSYWGDNLFIMDPGGANKTQITAFGGIARVYMVGPRWSPDGQYVAFATYYTTPESDTSECGLWIYGPIGEGQTPALRKLWSDAYLNQIHHLSWTPDLDDAPGYHGKFLVRLHHPNDSVTSGFRAFDVEIGTDGLLTFSTPDLNDIVLSSTWLEIVQTPYGLRAAWTITVDNAYYGIGVASASYDAGTDSLSLGAPTNLTPQNYLNARPRWSADGTRLVYDSAPAGSSPGTYDASKQEIYTMTVPASLEDVGSQANPYPVPTKITSNQLPDWIAAWSPPVF